MEFFISDTHFFSDNIIRYCNRPYANALEMNEDYIKRWNSVVGPNDTVYHLGDLLMHDPKRALEIVPRLNGNIVLCRGNHDTKNKLAVYREAGITDIRDMALIPYKGLFLVCCHFPMTNEEFLKMVQADNSEVVVVHGHVHDKTPFFTRENHCFNVSADVVNGTPVPITTIHHLVRHHYEDLGVWREEGIE